MCPGGRVSISCITGDNRRVYPCVISGDKAWRKQKYEIVSDETYPSHRYSLTINLVIMSAVKFAMWWKKSLKIPKG